MHCIYSIFSEYLWRTGAVPIPRITAHKIWFKTSICSFLGHCLSLSLHVFKNRGRFILQDQREETFCGQLIPSWKRWFHSCLVNLQNSNRLWPDYNSLRLSDLRVTPGGNKTIGWCFLGTLSHIFAFTNRWFSSFRQAQSVKLGFSHLK